MRTVSLFSAAINQVSIFLDQSLPPKTKQKRDCVTGWEDNSSAILRHKETSCIWIMSRIELKSPYGALTPWASGHFLGWLIPGLLLPCPTSVHSREPSAGMWAACPWATHHPELGSEQCWEQQSEREKHTNVSVPRWNFWVRKKKTKKANRVRKNK